MSDLPASHDERNWAMICHLSALSAFLIGIGFFVGPLVVWLIKRDQLPMVDRAGKEALNFNISWFIWFVVAAILVFALIGFVLLPVLGIAWLVLVIIAAVKAANGEEYRYPLTIRFLN